MINQRFKWLDLVLVILLSFSWVQKNQSQHHSVAREWNELNLYSIENDYTRPTIQARNLHHITAAMYDAWAAFDDESQPYFLGKTVHGYYIPYVPKTDLIYNSVDQRTCINYAAYRMLRHRYQHAPKKTMIYAKYDSLMSNYNLDTSFVSIDYSNGDPRALGNYIAHHIIAYGMTDGANEANDYNNEYYLPTNPPLKLDTSGTSGITDMNRWQPLAFNLFIDQGGNINPDNVPAFLSAEWGNVHPFALKANEKTVLLRDTTRWEVYNDPGEPPYIQDTTYAASFGLYDNFYKWGNILVNNWSSHHNIQDTTTWDISPRAIGNVTSYPTNVVEYPSFYNINSGGDSGKGYSLNPKTGQPYQSQMVKRADYSRALAEYWADGPNSETPPGHWYTILNQVNDHPSLIRKFKGEGRLLDTLEWDIKSYFALGGALHDAAISAWSIKGYYDYVRPISALRGMAELGQSSNPNLPNYNKNGLPLIPGYIELISKTDPLVGQNLEHLWALKIYCWRGYPYITENNQNVAGVGWIRAKEWVPYQRSTFVTPPFGGYVSGHSTFSRAAAEVLEIFTGDAFFPGGMGEFKIPKDSSLIHEAGPTSDVILQWAKYVDASDQCSLSRIWGGIHPPCDDIPGRVIGQKLGKMAIESCLPYFFKDDDGDGFYSYIDCDDQNPNIHPNHLELCDGLDNDCNSLIDEGLTLYSYYRDLDGDGYGNTDSLLLSCSTTNPNGFVMNRSDCDDTNSDINPAAMDIPDNGIDEDCNGKDFLSNTLNSIKTQVQIVPNPASSSFIIYNILGSQVKIKIINSNGVLVKSITEFVVDTKIHLEVQELAPGMYFVGIENNANDVVSEYIKLIVY